MYIGFMNERWLAGRRKYVLMLMSICLTISFGQLSQFEKSNKLGLETAECCNALPSFKWIVLPTNMHLITMPFKWSSPLSSHLLSCDAFIKIVKAKLIETDWVFHEKRIINFKSIKISISEQLQWLSVCRASAVTTSMSAEKLPNSKIKYLKHHRHRHRHRHRTWVLSVMGNKAFNWKPTAFGPSLYPYLLCLAMCLYMPVIFCRLSFRFSMALVSNHINLSIDILCLLTWLSVSNGPEIQLSLVNPLAFVHSSFFILTCFKMQLLLPVYFS